MARKERRGGAEARLEGLLDAGDWRDARVEAERLAGSGDAAGKEAAARALARLRPDPSARVTFVVSLFVLAAVAVAGLWPR